MSVEEKNGGDCVAALLPWFGSKRTLATVIVEEIGDHHTFFDPFCGSMAVLLAKPKARMETVNDLHGELVNLARVIQHPKLGSELYRRCKRMLMVEYLHREAAQRWKEIGIVPAPEFPDVDRAADFFYTSWVGRNGVTGTRSYNQGFAARYTPNGGHGGTRWHTAVRSIPQFRKRIFETTILNRCGFKLLSKVGDEAGVVIYVDPPYVVKGSRYVFDDDLRPASVSDAIWHDAISWAQEHRRLDISVIRVAWHWCLAQQLNQFRNARIVLSYYDNPLVHLLYPRWTVRKCPTIKALVSGNGRAKGSVEAPEILLINGPSYAPNRTGLFGGGA